MPFSELDTAAVARTLSQIAEQPEDVVDAFFERREEAELPPEDEGPGLRVRREEGFAIRLSREGHTWLAARDNVDARPFAEALRQVARALPSATYPEPAFKMPPFQPDPHVPHIAAELAGIPEALSRAIRSHHVGFPSRLTVRRHRRWVQVVGSRLVAGQETETFYSLQAQTTWGGHGAIHPRLDANAIEAFAASLVHLFRARQASLPEPYRGTAILAPAAVAVLLHEAVAHALEADVLAQGGNPEAAVGVSMAAPSVDVLDDPAAAPAEVRRTTDDEGSAVFRRWLLRGGVVEQPLADLLWARTSPVFVPGAGRRGTRHLPPGPRSTHLEMLHGDATDDDLLTDADGGLYLQEASRGALDPLSGEFRLHLPFARRIRRGALGDTVGPCVLRGRVADLLTRVTAVGREARPAGAGWCAKGGQKLPVWATAPTLRLEGVEIVPEGGMV
ncbi:MAG TPA: metallopeptidase TldD-related protein [Thermoanaerobaculia bacterium]|jgi:predicted Zn-dependent protease|nr:metallopeptidase TldD-related protein [Thermoanaerobaculia bacterium]